jgi:hypothetical protein
MTLHHLLTLLRRPPFLASAAGLRQPAAATESRPSASPLPELDAEELQAAIALHHAWCQLFHEHLGAASDDQSVLAELPSADNSGLGQWIARISQGPDGGHPLLVELAQENRRVHRIALQALDYARSRRVDLASNLLNLAFERSRTRVLDILRRLQHS